MIDGSRHKVRCSCSAWSEACQGTFVKDEAQRLLCAGCGIRWVTASLPPGGGQLLPLLLLGVIPLHHCHPSSVVVGNLIGMHTAAAQKGSREKASASQPSAGALHVEESPVDCFQTTDVPTTV